MMLHGAAKVGKTRLADTGPAPRLVLDAENGNKWTDSRKVLWEPTREAPPQPDGTWDTTVVLVRSCDDLARASQWLQSGAHPFKTVTLDSVSELQQRCMDSMVGESSMDQQAWGELLRMLSVRLRGFRDLTMHPTNPLECVTFIAMSKMDKAGKVVPYVQGQLQAVLPYITDACVYLYTDVDAATGQVVVRGLTSAHPQYEAGDRTGRLPAVMDAPTLPRIFELLYGQPQAPVESPPAPVAHSVSVPEAVPLDEVQPQPGAEVEAPIPIPAAAAQPVQAAQA
jgi:hypothetical protein